jgi:hypothetical protein
MWLKKFQEAYETVLEGSRGLKKDMRRKQAFAKSLANTDSFVDYKNDPKKASKVHSMAFHSAQKMNTNKDTEFEYKDAAEKLHDWGTPENLELANKLKKRHPVKVFHMVNTNIVSNLENTFSYLIDNSMGHEDEKSPESDDEISVSVKKGVWNVSDSVVLSGFARLTAYYPTDVNTRPIGGNDIRKGLKVAQQPNRPISSHHWDEATAKLGDIFWVAAYIGEECQNTNLIRKILTDRNIKIERSSSNLGSVVDNTEADEQEIKEKSEEYYFEVSSLIDLSKTVNYAKIKSDELKTLYARLEKETPDDIGNYELVLFDKTDKVDYIIQQTQEIRNLQKEWRLLKDKIQSNFQEAFNKLEERDPSTYNAKSLVKSIQDYAFKKKLPAPEKKLDSGSDALIFETDNEFYLIRVEEFNDDENPEDLRELKFLNDPYIKETGGVAEITHWATIKANNKNYLVTWKEKVNTNIENYLYDIYPEETVYEILRSLNLCMLDAGNFSKEDSYRINTLKKYPETQPLVNAIERGLPNNDLSPENNLGINSQGNIVAYDC